MAEKVEIISSGLLCADIVVKPVERLPEAGTAGVVETIELSCGGCGLNTAIVLKKLGVSAGIIGKIGRDTFGDHLAREIEAFGLDARGIKRDPDTRTTSALVMVLPSGERSFLYAPGGSSEMISLDDFDFELIGQAGILHVGGIMKLTSLDVAEVFKRAKDLGVVTSLDTDWDTSGKWLERIEGCLRHTDIFLPSREEAMLISRRQTPRQIGEFFLAYGIETFVLKLGEGGCYVRTASDELTLPAYAVDVLDTTGAGDAFDAGFLAGRLKGWDVEKCARFANACGALCTTRIGTSAGIETMEAVLAFMEEATLRTGV